MSYAAVSDVRAIVDTDLTDAEIINIITWADDWVNKKIDAPAATVAFRANLSSSYAGFRCLMKDPDAIKLGELSTDRATTIKLWKQELDELVALGGGGMSFTAAVETLA